MTTSCKLLAERYAKETGIAIPDANADTQVRLDWLLTSVWGCYPPNGTEFKDKDWCFQNNNLPAPKTSPISSTLNTRPPYLNYLKEDGFLHWVNQRGLQCVNRIIGNFYGLNPATGLANVPGPTNPFPDSRCAASCQDFTSPMCTECIYTVLNENPSICPQIDVNNQDDENLIQESINCHQCIGNRGEFISQPNEPNVPDNTAMCDFMWACIIGEVSPGLSTSAIVIIVVSSVFLVTIALTLGLYFGVFRPRILKQQAERAKLEAAGVEPDEV
jgi:hypothetical protein